ncbi:MAG: OB-fold nucleic acid binding domain-containing protein [Candidatus Aenigmatarchaeota archaeon]
MAMERVTTRKTRIADITAGQWVKKEGFEPSFIITKEGHKISRARILATIVSKFTAEDGNFGSITLDDTTDTIRAKTFKTVKPLEGLDIGTLVDVIGKIKEYNGEIYVIPEIIRKIDDPNFLTLRILETKSNRSESTEEKEESVVDPEEKNDLRMDIIKIIENSKDGATFKDIIKNVKAEESQIESVINELLSEGVCYEPTPGKIKKI